MINKKQILSVVMAGALGMTALPVYADILSELEGSSAEQLVSEKSEELKSAKIELQRARIKTFEQRENMQMHLKYLRGNKNNPWLEMMMGSKNLADLMDRVEYIVRMAQLDKALLGECQNEESRILEKKENLEDQLAVLNRILNGEAVSEAEIVELVGTGVVSGQQYGTGEVEDVYQASVYEEAGVGTDENSASYAAESNEYDSGNSYEETYQETTENPAADSGIVYPWNFNPEEDTMEHYSSAVTTEVTVEYGDYSANPYYGFSTYEEDTYGEVYENQGMTEASTYGDMSFLYGEVGYDDTAAGDVSSGNSYGDADLSDGEMLYEVPSYEESLYGEPTYEEPSYEEPTYEEPSYGEPTYEEPAYEEPSSEENYTDGSQGTYLGNFTITAYCGCALCCGMAGQPTASGSMPVQGYTVAMGGVPFGTQLLINGCVYTVEDRGTPYGHVDIYFDSHEAALNFGLQTADVYQLN